MRNIPAALLLDGYKVGHVHQYPKDTQYVYSNLTPRSPYNKEDNAGGVIFFGLQYFIKEYLIDQFNEWFARPEEEAMKEYDDTISKYLGPGFDSSHIRALHKLGYLPITIRALPEGTFVPYGIPCMTIINTKPDFFWLVNYLETLLSASIWKATTSATTAFEFRQTFEKFSRETVSDEKNEFISWQGHDFSFRGMSSVEDACVSGAGHLLSFLGTDTIPAIKFLENYYNAENDFVAGSVPATEHSVLSFSSKACAPKYVEEEWNESSQTWDFVKLIY